MKKSNFKMVPRDLINDPRLQPYLQRKGVNPREIVFIIEEMMDRLSRNQEMTINEMIAGFPNKHVAFKYLKEIVTSAGLCICNGEKVIYDWGVYQNLAGKVVTASETTLPTASENPSENPSVIPQKSLGSPSAAPARSYYTPNGDILETEKETENIQQQKKEEKEKKSNAEDEAMSRIRPLVAEYHFAEGEARADQVERLFLQLLRAKSGQLPYLIQRESRLPDIAGHWDELVVAFAEQMYKVGRMGALFNWGDVSRQFTFFCNTAKRFRYYNPGAAMLERINEERKREAESRAEELRRRYPYETVNAETGERFASGMPIPEDAPPRPSPVAVWDYEACLWEEPATETREARLARQARAEEIYQRQKLNEL